jgi:predicted ATP-binding protein involved in virulence
MRLETLDISNFRSFNKISFRFDPNLNLIVGINGGGKSSLLAAIAVSLNPGISAFYSDMTYKGIGLPDVRFETELVGLRARFERRFPTTVRATGTFFEEKLDWTVRRDVEVGYDEFPMEIYMPAANRRRSLDLAGLFVMPFVGVYGAHRSGVREEITLEKAASQQLSRLDGYESWHNALAGSEQLETWIVGKTLERLQMLSEGETSVAFREDELSIVNGAIEDCIPGAKSLTYDLKLRSLMLEFYNGSPIPFFSLSDGQQSVISLFADIARRICILNPHLGPNVLIETNGILCIDEIDIHLHPAWQRQILKNLREKFPLLQIFATAHSPQMIGGLQPKEVLILHNGIPSHPSTTFGLDSSKVLEEIMNTDSREPEISHVIREMFLSIERNDLESAKREVRRLKKLAPQLPEYAQIEALILRKETIGR